MLLRYMLLVMMTRAGLRVWHSSEGELARGMKQSSVVSRQEPPGTSLSMKVGVVLAVACGRECPRSFSIGLGQLHCIIHTALLFSCYYCTQKSIVHQSEQLIRLEVEVRKPVTLTAFPDPSSNDSSCRALS